MKTTIPSLPIPINESARLKALYSYNILDTLHENQLDRLTKLASIICEVPIALISLIDSDRQWFKSAIGLELDQTTREISFCQYTIMGEDFFEVEDALLDHRFCQNPLVLGQPNIRFYAAYPLIDPAGYLLGSLCVIDQISKKLTDNQRLALKTLSEDIMLQIVNNKKNEEREKLEKIFLMSSDLICITTLDGVCKKVNPAFVNILGWTDLELQHKQIVDLIHHEDVAGYTSEMKKIVKSGSGGQFKTRLITKENDYLHFQWVVNTNLQTGEIYGIARDITAQTIIEEDLRHSKIEADSAREMQEKFLANMSHEIRTPMNAILGFSTILSNTELNIKQKELISNIKISSENLLGIINDILDISKIQSGMLQIENTIFNLPEHLEKINMMMIGKAMEKNLEFSIRLSPLLPDFVVSDPTRISQILINMISNAIKFTNKGFVNVRADLFRRENKKLFIKFIVQDSGIGIAPQNINIIFERFRQESSETTRIFGGTGLGLSIANDMVKLLGGELAVESKLGKGTEFMVIIPMEECDEYQIVEYKNSLAGSRQSEIPIPVKLGILLVDDNRMNSQYCSLLLDEYGFLCTVASSGNEALSILKDQKFDLILMDIQMPEMDGYETTHIIRNKMKINTPIIALTANAMPGERKKVMSCGMDAYISKPFKPTDLYDKIIEIYNTNDRHGNHKIDAHILESSINLIDIKILRENANGKLNLMNQLFKIFIDDNPGDLSNLKNAIDTSDYDLIGMVAHKLISNYSILGINTALEIIKSIEVHASHKSEMNTIRSLFDDLVEITEQVKLEISQL